MHIVYLSIGCTLGVKKNTSTKEVNENRLTKRITEVVTPGGLF